MPTQSLGKVLSILKGLEKRIEKIEKWIDLWENYDSGWRKKSKSLERIA